MDDVPFGLHGLATQVEDAVHTLQEVFHRRPVGQVSGDEFFVAG